MTKVIGQQFTTALTVSDLAAFFKSTAQARYDSLGRASRMALKGRGVEFFTPEADDDPFAQFEERPAFAVGVTMPRGGSFVGSAEPVTLHMYVTERGDRRAVEFTLPVSSAMDRLKDGQRGFRAATRDPLGHSNKGAGVILDYFSQELLARDRAAKPVSQ